MVTSASPEIIEAPLTPEPPGRRFRLRPPRFGSGADLVFMIVGSIIVLFFLFVAIFPWTVASYDPHETVGPRLLPPNSSAPGFAVMTLPGSGVTNLGQSTKYLHVGVLAGPIPIGSVPHVFKEQATGHYIVYADRYDTVSDLAASVRNKTEQVALLPTTSAAELTSRGFATLRTMSGQYTGRSYLFGTDELGRDVLSRVIYGTRLDLVIGLVAPAISAIVGLLIGISSAFAGGRIDRVIAAVMDAIYSMPATIIAIALAASIGPGLGNLILALSVVYVPTFFRLARSRALSVKQELFIDATTALGAGRLRLIGRHILPHSMLSVGVFSSVAVAEAIRTAATLSFLGLGLSATTVVEWGSDIATGRLYVQQAWWLLGGPGLALTLLIFGLTLVSDAMFETLGPRSRRTRT